MSVRSKTKRRLLILVTGFGLTCGAAVGVYAFRMRQIDRDYRASRELGLAAFRAGDWEAAVHNLGRYIKREKYADDVEAIFYLAEAARGFEVPDAGNIDIAVWQYKRFLDLQPHRDDLRRELLPYYREVNARVEALAAAEHLLRKDPSDLAAIKAKAWALSAMDRPAEALPFARRAVSSKGGDPLDLDMQVLLLQLYLDPRNGVEAGNDEALSDVPGAAELTPRQLLVRRARKLLADHPADGRFELLASTACSLAGELPPDDAEQIKRLLSEADPSASSFDHVAAARHFARLASTRPLSSLRHTRLLLEQLQSLGMAAETLAVLDKSQAFAADPWLRRFAIRRLLESERFTDLDKRLAGMTLRASRPSDVELLGIRGVMLLRLARPEQVRPIAIELSAQNADKVAQAWGAALSHLLEPGGDTLEVARACREALKVRRDNPYLSFFLAEIHQETGERDLAIEHYTLASRRSPLWALPHSRLARLHAEAGDYASAHEHAYRALRLNPGVQGAVDHVLTFAAVLGEERLAGASGLLKQVEEVQRVVPLEDRTLPLYVRLLAENAQRDRAGQVLAKGLTAEPARSEGCLLRLAALARELRLGDPAGLLALAEKKYGLTPEHALTRAVDLERAGRADEAMAFMEDALRRKPAGTTLHWRLVWARYLDRRDDPRAAAEWVALGDDKALEKNSAVQRSALLASSVQGDAEFIRRTMDRLRAMTGEQGSAWRKARARLLLSEDDQAADVTEAVKLLKEVAGASPQDIEARTLLALALKRSGEPRAALEHAAYVLERRPTPASRLLAAELFQMEDDPARAGEQLAVLAAGRLTRAERLGVARLYALRGETAPAVALLERIPADEIDAASGMLLAELHHRRGQPAKAEALYLKLLSQPRLAGPRHALLAAAAEFFAATDRIELARQVLDNLATMKLAPGARELILADFYARHGPEAQAVEQFVAATRAAPSDPMTWRAMVTHHLRKGRVDEALAACESAVKSARSPRGLSDLRQHAALVREAAALPRLLPLASAVVNAPQDAAAALDALRIYTSAAASKERPSDTIERLRPVADRAPRLVPLQLLLAEDCLAAGRRTEAAALAERALRVMPHSAELARSVARTLADAGDLARAIDAAQRWRDLAPAQSLEADLLLANLELRRKDTRAALAKIERHLEKAAADPAKYREVIALRTAIHLHEGEVRQASELAASLEGKGPQWRTLWADLAQSVASAKGGGADAAAQWLDKAEAEIAQASDEELTALAAAWFRISRMSGNPSYRQRSRLLLDRVLGRSPRHANAVYSLAVINELEGRFDDAEAGYRSALSLGLRQPVAANNLAMLIVRRQGDLAEARRFIASAIDDMPHMPAFHDTMAIVQVRLKDYKGAVASLRAALRLDAANAEWKARLAMVLAEAGELREAASVLEELDSTAASSIDKLPEELRRGIRLLRDKLSTGAAQDRAPAGVQ